MARYGTIISTGRYVPETDVPNAEIERRVTAAHPDLAGVIDKFFESSGIRTRKYAPRDWATSDCGKKRHDWIQAGY